MIHLFGVSFRNFSYVRKSIESILNNASEEICMTVVENPCDWPNSDTQKIRDYLRSKIEEGKIKRALFMNQNTIGWGLAQALKDFPPDNSEKFMCLTDLDLAMDDGCDWIKEIRTAHENGAVYTGSTLHMRNFVPPNWGYGGDEDGFGLWLTAPNIELYYKYFTTDNNTIDSNLIAVFNHFGKVQKLLSIRLYHMAWDNHLYDLEYAEYKKKLGSSWVFQGKPQDMSYELITKENK